MLDQGEGAADWSGGLAGVAASPVYTDCWQGFLGGSNVPRDGSQQPGERGAHAQGSGSVPTAAAGSEEGIEGPEVANDFLRAETQSTPKPPAI